MEEGGEPMEEVEKSMEEVEKPTTRRYQEMFDNICNYSHLYYSYGPHLLRKMNQARILILAGEEEGQIIQLKKLLSCLFMSGFSDVSINVPISEEYFGGSLTVISSDHLDKKLSTSDAVIFIRSDYESAVTLSNACKKEHTSFLWACQIGPLLSMFAQVAKPFVSKLAVCGHLSLMPEVNAAVMNCSYAHGLKQNDLVRINQNLYKVDLVSETVFHCYPEGEQSHQCLSTLPLSEEVEAVLTDRLDDVEPKRDADMIVSESVWNPKFTSPDENAFADLYKHATFLSKIKINQTVGQISTRLDVTEEQKKHIYNLEERIFALNDYSQFHYGVFAGLVTNQLSNILTGKYASVINQWMHLELPKYLNTSPCQNPEQKKLTILINGLSPLAVYICDILLNQSDIIKTLIIAAGKQTVDLSLLINCNKIFKPQDLGKDVFSLLEDYANARGSSVVLKEVPANVPENENIYFGMKFFQNVDLMINADGSCDDRRNISCQSVQHSKPLIDVGIYKFCGSIQSVIPQVTDSYNCTNDPLEVELPFCVMKSFPFLAEHCIDWAKLKVENLTQAKPQLYNEFREREGPDLIFNLKTVSDFVPDNVFAVEKYIKTFCFDWRGCVVFAREKFEKYFNHKALQLLKNFPENCTKGKGNAKFWTYPKRAPNPVTFDVDKEAHLDFIKYLARAMAITMNIKVTETDLEDETFRSILADIKLPPFQPQNKTVITDESISKPEAINVAVQDIDKNELAHKLSNLFLKLTVVKDENLLEKLLIATANMRCEMYSIPQPNYPELYRASRKICPCPIHMINILSDLTVMKVEEYHNYFGSAKAFTNPSDCWISLDFMKFIFSSSKPASKVKGFNMTLWTKLEVRGKSTWTLNDFLDSAATIFGARPNMIVQGTKMVFVEAIPGHSKRKDKLMSSLINRKSSDFVTLNITCPFEAQEDLGLPPIKYFPNDL